MSFRNLPQRRERQASAVLSANVRRTCFLAARSQQAAFLTTSFCACLDVKTVTVPSLTRLAVCLAGEKGKKRARGGKPGSKAGAPGEAAAGGDAARKPAAPDDEYLGFIIGALATLILLLFVLIAVIIVRQRKHKLNNNHQVTAPPAAAAAVAAAGMEMVPAVPVAAAVAVVVGGSHAEQEHCLLGPFLLWMRHALRQKFELVTCDATPIDLRRDALDIR